MGYQPVGRAGSHLKLRYVHPETGDIRNVTIPMGNEIRATHSATLPTNVVPTTSSDGVTGLTTSSDSDYCDSVSPGNHDS